MKISTRGQRPTPATVSPAAFGRGLRQRSVSLCRALRSAALALSLLSASCYASWAQQSPEEVMARAERILEKNQETEATFSTTHHDSKGRAVSKSSGQILISGLRFRLSYEGIVAVYDGQTLTHYDASEQTLTLSTPSADELLEINPLSFLRARGEGFRMREHGSTTAYRQLLFVPRGKSNIRQVAVRFSRQTGLPLGLVIWAGGGEWLDVQITNIRAAGSVPRGSFELKASSYPGCEVVDLR